MAPARPWSRLDGRPLVSMSFGSQIFHQPALFRYVIDATAALDVQLVCSVGDLDLGPLPSHVLTVPYFPQLPILKRSAVFITHGGANSVMEAITLGAPMLVAPLCNDQFHNAAFVARAGIGLTLDLASSPTATVEQALRRLLSDASLRARMKDVSASYRAHDGSARAAEQLMRWLT